MAELDPLPADIAALLDVERRAPGPPAGAEATVLARLEETLGFAPGGGGGGGGGGGAGAGGLSGWAVGVAAISLVAGVGVGALVMGGRGQEPAASVARAQEVAEEVVAPSAPPVVEEPVFSVDEAAVRVSSAAPAKAQPSPLASLAAEQALLDAARGRLAAGDARGARRSLVEHEERFPRGALAEERAVLVVVALVRAGERALAADAARDFRARYPDSLHAGTIAAALDESTR